MMFAIYLNWKEIVWIPKIDLLVSPVRCLIISSPQIRILINLVVKVNYARMCTAIIAPFVAAEANPPILLKTERYPMVCNECT